jgi:hypothetical protein
LPSGAKFYNPMRILPNNDGSELVFTVYRRPDVSDQEFAEDANSVEKDLAKLKTLLEESIRRINEIAAIRAARAIDPLSNIFVLEPNQQLGF